VVQVREARARPELELALVQALGPELALVRAQELEEELLEEQRHRLIH